MIKKMMILLLICGVSAFAKAQNDSIQIRKIYDEALKNGNSYEWLNYLSNQIGSRLSGSLGAEKAVNWTKEQLDSVGLDKVWLQPVMVPKWVRGLPEYAFIDTGDGETTQVPICALGGSVATPNGSVKASVIEVQSIEEIERLGAANVGGKIVFFNRPMQEDIINTFEAYGGCVD